MKKLMVTLAGLAFCATALAGDPGNPNNGAAGGGIRSGTTYSRAKYDQILGRLGLTDEQIKKIDAIFVAYGAKVRELYKKLNSEDADKRAVYKKFRAQQEALNAERDKKILEVLTDAQKKLYLLAKKLVTADQETHKKIYAEIRAAYKDAGRDKAKRTATQKKFAGQFKAMRAALSKALDKIGKLPKHPRGDDSNGTTQGRPGSAA